MYLYLFKPHTMKHFISIFSLILLMTSCGQSQNKNVQPPIVDHAAYKTSNTTNMNEVYEFIKACPYYFIATVDQDQPRVRPFGTIHIFEGKLYIQTGHSKNVAKQIAANPKVEICAYNGKEWIRVAASLVDDTRIEAKRSMLDAYPNLQSMYSAEDENTAVFYMTDATATISSFTEPARTITF